MGPAWRPPVAASARVDSRSLSTTATAYCGSSSGANAIIQVRFTSAEVAAGAAEILVYGTGVVLEEEAGEGE